MAERPRKSWAERKLAIIVNAIVGVLATMTLLILALIWVSSDRGNKVVLWREEISLRSALDRAQEQLTGELSGVLTLAAGLDTRDLRAVEAHVARPLAEGFGHDRFFLVDAGSDQVLYAQSYMRRMPPPAFGQLGAGTRREIDHARRDEADHHETQLMTPAPTGVGAADVTGFSANICEIDGALALVATRRVFEGEGRSGPIAVSMKRIDAARLARTAGEYRVTGVRLARAAEVATGERFLPLAGTGTAARGIAWTPVLYGSQIVRQVLPWILAALVLIWAGAIVLVRRLRATAAALAEREREQRRLAETDTLSTLPNRRHFGERLSTMLLDASVSGSRAFLVAIDVDHFKDVNDTLGHQIGDQLIGAVARRLSRVSFRDDLIARLGGDEFAFVRAGVSSPTEAEAVTESLRKVFLEPFVVDGHRLTVTASFGIACAGCGGMSAEELMRRADIALYHSKARGRNCISRHDEEMEAAIRRRTRLETDLRAAVTAGSIDVAYQPVMDAAGERVTGVEALCRWTHPELGPISPVEFVRIAEASDLVHDLGLAVARRALADAARWPGLRVAINLSPVQLRAAASAADLAAVVTASGIDPARVEWEVTESVLVDENHGARERLEDLRALGCTLALDDFGTGYSSLSYLRSFRFDKLKIDRSFVQGAESSAEAAEIVHAVVSLGRALSMRVTAEGVETAEQHRFLRAAGCTEMQGWLFHKAMPAAGIDALVGRPDAPLALSA